MPFYDVTISETTREFHFTLEADRACDAEDLADRIRSVYYGANDPDNLLEKYDKSYFVDNDCLDTNFSSTYSPYNEYLKYKLEWCKERGYDINDIDPEYGINGECYVSYHEWYNNEFHEIVFNVEQSIDAPRMSTILDKLGVWASMHDKEWIDAMCSALGLSDLEKLIILKE